MQLKNLVVTLPLFVHLILLSVLFNHVNDVSSQQPAFELPVQLVGFPVIILAVRMSNFVRKLAYSLNPNTYKRSGSRSVRHLEDFSGVSGIADGQNLDVVKAENYLVSQLGSDVCIYEEACLEHVKSAGTKSYLDWDKILRDFFTVPGRKQQFYLLSVFLGDVLRSNELCHHFKKVGRSCQ